MLSITCKASIKAVIYLGSKLASNEKSSVLEIAEFIYENEHTVAKLLQKLVKGNIIKSAKGPTGGFYITTKQKNLRVIDIVEVIDGKDVFTQCGLGLSKCSEARPCPFHNDFKPVREQFKNLCYSKKVSDLYENINNGLAYLV